MPPMRIMSFVCASLATTLGASSAFAAENNWHWILLGDDNIPYLSYEQVKPDPDRDTRFILICDNERRTAEVTVHEADRKMRRGTPVTIELSAADTRVVLKGTIRTDSGIYGYARKAPYRAIVALLRAPGPVTVRMNRNTYDLPEQGRAEQLKALTESCRLKG